MIGTCDWSCWLTIAVKAFVTFMGMGAGPSEGCYEMSVGNADKGMLPIDEVIRRVQPFVEENLPIVLTQVMQPPQAVCWLLCIFL